MGVPGMMNFIFAFFCSLCFAILYNVKGKFLFFAPLGGAICRLIFDFTVSGGVVFEFFLASTALALYAEVMARLTKVPVMIYLIIGVLPIVPGAGVYNTMASLFEGDMVTFAEVGTSTLLGAGAIALAFMTVSSVVRIFKIRRFPILRQFTDRRYMPWMK